MGRPAVCPLRVPPQVRLETLLPSQPGQPRRRSRRDAGGVVYGYTDDRYRAVLHRAFMLAAETGELCRPVHLLAALAEGDGPIADILRSPGGGPLLPRPTNPLPVHGGGCNYYVVGQAQGAVHRLASERGETAGPEHLFLVVLDQAEDEAMALLTSVGLDPAVLRAEALSVLGAPPDLPPTTMPPLTPAGTMDRPALPVEALDQRAWAVLCWRQEHLPLGRLRRRSHYEALWQLEYRASWRVASKLGLDEDQRYSLVHHHLCRVEDLAARAEPALVERRLSRPREPIAMMGTVTLGQGRRRWRRWRYRWLGFTVGWGCWFSNRRAGVRDRWFRLRTIPNYRGAPQP